MVARLLTLIALFTALPANAAEISTLQLPSGQQVPVLGIRKTTLHESNEVALVLTYQTTKDFSNIMSVASEVEQVWVVFKIIAEQEKVGAAVVIASEAPHPFALVKSAGWFGKRAPTASGIARKKRIMRLSPRRQV